jgi:hypothetical protein
MRYGICNLSVVPLRIEPSDRSEMTSQVLYGEFFKILEQRKEWSRIRLAYDKYEGWIDNKQYLEISKLDYDSLNSENQNYSADFIEFIQDADERLTSIPIGSTLSGIKLLGHCYDGKIVNDSPNKPKLIETALLFLNSPYLWGGKTPFGIDCSGFTQMVYKLNGIKLFREASKQATQGDALSFIEESEPGDLAFFDDAEGNIIHVGIIMEDNHIIHAHGKVRIDRLDQSGIYNVDLKTHTHKLRVIKQIA